MFTIIKSVDAKGLSDCRASKRDFCASLELKEYPSTLRGYRIATSFARGIEQGGHHDTHRIMSLRMYYL